MCSRSAPLNTGYEELWPDCNNYRSFANSRLRKGFQVAHAKSHTLPGSNLPPVTFFDVRILTPDENVTRTPSNEPLRFVASVKPKKRRKNIQGGNT